MKKFTLLAIALLTIGNIAIADDSNRTFELRTYHTNKGKLDALHARFRDHTVKLFTKHGMTNVAYWVPKDNKGQVLIYLLSYPSREAREKSWKGFLNDPDWKAAFKASTVEGRLIYQVDSVFMSPTDFSPEFKIGLQNPARLFELRQYTTNKGKLPDIQARFRDHTIELFTKHGLTNLPYFQLDEDQDGAKNTLIYFLSHKDEAGRKAGFKAFGQDPAWKSARENSEKNGKILIKGGVKSTLLIPTDYSPTK